jgi:hypothetical protein
VSRLLGPAYCTREGGPGGTRSARSATWCPAARRKRPSRPAWTGGAASVQGWRAASTGAVAADGADRAGRVFTPADQLPMAAQQLARALAGSHGRGQALTGLGLSLPVAGCIGACRVTEAQPDQHPQAVSIEGKNGPGLCEQVNAVRPRPPDARVGALRRPGDGKFCALALVIPAGPRQTTSIEVEHRCCSCDIGGASMLFAAAPAYAGRRIGGARGTEVRFPRPRRPSYRAAMIWPCRSSSAGTSSRLTRPIPHSVQMPQSRRPPGLAVRAASMSRV